MIKKIILVSVLMIILVYFYGRSQNKKTINMITSSPKVIDLNDNLRKLKQIYGNPTLVHKKLYIWKQSGNEIILDVTTNEIFTIIKIQIPKDQIQNISDLDSRLAYNGHELRAKSTSLEINNLMLEFAIKIFMFPDQKDELKKCYYELIHKLDS